MNKLKTMKKQYDHMTYYNLMAPFPVYDTDRVKALEKRIIEMEKIKEDYNTEPVFACKHCKSLNIRTDELENNVCFKCGSVNDLETYETIYEYNKMMNERNK